MLALADAVEVHLSIDGTDEVDPDLNLVKCRSGSLLSEKMIEGAGGRFVIIVDESKLVPRLGCTGVVPVEYNTSSPNPSTHHLSLHQKPTTAKVTALEAKMQYNGATFRMPPIVPEMQYPTGIIVETTLRVWAISHWRGQLQLTDAFLCAGYSHLPLVSPVMFRLEEVRDGGGSLVPLLARFTNRFDAFILLGQVFWCGCEFIAFTMYNIFNDLDSIFPAANRMHSLPYNVDEDED
ncbi:hypothetical protein ACQ4PT_007574 [Festuca glaucescens]